MTERIEITEDVTIIEVDETHVEIIESSSQAVTELTQALQAHKTDTSNPHAVTKAQIGLGSVDNTPDTAKPVSTAQQVALNGKATLLNIPASSVPARRITGTGEPSTYYLVDSNPAADTVAYRTTGGQLRVGTAVLEDAATTKAQLDAGLALRVSKAGDTMTGRLENSVSTMIGYAQTRGGSQVLFGADANGRFHAYNNTSGSSIITAESTGIALGLWDAASPRIVKGTGFPNGVVSAPVGSIYIDTAVTNGASSWIKKSGTGNTGWQVLEGDTGWRNVTSLLGVYWKQATSTFWIRRVNGTVYLRADALRYDPGATTLTARTALRSLTDNLWPTGFGIGQWNNIVDSGVMVQGVPGFATLGAGSSDIGVRAYTSGVTTGNWTNDDVVAFNINYLTPASWPTTLPGTAV